MKTFRILFLLCLLTFPFLMQASHMMGAEITYKWLGNRKFEVSVKIYRDCRGIPLNSPTISVSDYNGTTIALSYTRTSIEDITLRCSDTISKPCNPANTTVGTFGIELHTFVGTVDFSTSPFNAFPNKNACKIYFTVEQCCRNGAITTLNQGNLYVDAMLDICNSKFQNTSPQFKSNNVMNALCSQTFSQNFGSKDFVDYDSLAYELTNPLNGPGSNEAYQGSFNSSIPMTPYCLPPGVINCSALPNAKPPRGFYFNKLTGDIVFTPSNCSEVGVISVKISEYRKDSVNSKWKLVGYVIRDIQIGIVTGSGNNLAPTSNLATTYNFRTRENQCIDIKVSDTAASGSSSSNKGDRTSMSIVELPSGATFRYLDSTAKNKTGRLCWKIHDSVYLKFKNKNKLLPMTLEFRDNFCPIPSVLQKSFSIKILPPDSSGFLSVNTFTDANKNNRKDTGDKGLPVLLKFKDVNSVYYVETDIKGKLEDSIGVGKVNIGVATHPYFTSSVKDTNLIVKMDSTYRLNFGIHQSSGIYGRIYEDANANCQYDKGELPYSGYKVFTDSNKYVGISDMNGVYLIKAPKGSYNIKCDYKPDVLTVNCPVSKTISISINGDSAYMNNDFGVSKNMKYTDVSTGISLSRIRRGNVCSVIFYCMNNGPTTRKNIKLYSPVNSKFDLTYNSSLFASAGSTAVVKIDSIKPYKSFSIKLDFYVSPTGFKANDNLCFSLQTDSVTTTIDTLKTNNSAQECRVVDAPYDPNEKRVATDSAKTVIDQFIAYTIHFQNTGTDTATRIVVKDTINPKYLDMSKFEMNWSDYPCETIITGNVIHFIFNNINLPYLSKSGEKSMAGFNFTLGLKTAITKETSFSNKAAIYFDYENPIFTKDAIATIGTPLVLNKVRKTSLCRNESNTVCFKSRVPLKSGNKLILELSDINGSFNTPYVLKTISSTSVDDSMDFNLPSTYNAAKYTLRLRSTNPSATSIASTGQIGFNVITPPAYIVNSNIKNNKGCEKDTLRINFSNSSYLYKVIRNNVSSGNFTNTSAFEFIIKSADSFKFIGQDINSGCMDTSTLFPSIFQKPVISANILNRKKEYCSGEQIAIAANGGVRYTYIKNNATIGTSTVNPYNTLLDATSVYQVTGEDINGCTNQSDTMNVSVKPSPAASIATSPSPICQGDTVVTLVYGTAPTYDLYWNKAILLSKTNTSSYKISNPVNGDNYQIKAFGTNGCSTLSPELSIVINPVPDKPVITKNNNDLSVNFTGTIKWYRNGILLTNTSNTLTNAPGGTYRVIVTNPEGCINSSNTFVHQNTGLGELLNGNFRVYPNPAAHQLSVETVDASATFDIKLFDMNGKIVYQSSVNVNSETIDISEFSAGLYTLRIECRDGQTINRMVSFVR